MQFVVRMTLACRKPWQARNSSPHGRGLSVSIEGRQRWGNKADRTETRREQDESLPSLWNAILGAFDHIVPKMIADKGFPKFCEHFMIEQSRDVFHRYKIGLRLAN